MATMFTGAAYHPGRPNCTIDGSYTVSRKDEKTKQLNWTFTFKNHLNNGHSGVSERTVCIVQVDGTHTSYGMCTLASNSTVTVNIDADNEGSTASIRVVIYHNAGSNAGPTMGSDGYPKHNCTHGYADYVWESGVSVPAYNPYTKPTYSITSMTSIGRVDVTDYTLKYTIKGGSENLSWVDQRYYDNGSNTVKHKRGINTSKGDNLTTTAKVTSGNGFQHGKIYQTNVVFSDGGDRTYSTSKLTFRTYQEPKINTGVTLGTSQPQNANTANSFTISGTNNRAFNDDNLEKEFQTHYRIKRGSDTYTGWINLNNITTWNRTASEMRSLISDSYDNQNCTIEFKRYSPSANWYSTNTASTTLKLYYRPRVGITNDSVSYCKNDSKGTGITKNQIITNDSSLTGVYVKWIYDTNDVNAGYTNGYRIQLFDYNNTTAVKTYYTSDKYITIPKEDIPRLNNTYITITPYYIHKTSSGNTNWYFNGTIEKIPFVRMVCELDKPIIDYPINASNWINKDFRVCFSLPADGDHDYVVTETYQYESIEVRINNQIFKIKNANGTSAGSILNNTIFSCLDTAQTYERKVIAWPNKANITTAGSYTISVRVKKKYGTTTAEHRWSPWSDSVTIFVTIPTYSVNPQDLIMATHFNDLLDTVDRIRNTYGVPWINKQLPAVKKSTIIEAKQYSQANLLNKLVETKNVVNTYGDFDTGRKNIKFDSTDQLPTTFDETKGEYITSDKDGTFTSQGQTRTGRNYIKYAYDRCNLLK